MKRSKGSVVRTGRSWLLASLAWLPVWACPSVSLMAWVPPESLGQEDSILLEELPAQLAEPGPSTEPGLSGADRQIITPQSASIASTSATEADESGEVLWYGPVHEAFAEPYTHEPVDGLIIDREPPPPVAEIPPESRPTGENVIWISGYWFWDEERDDFIWVSGVWRQAPPDKRWLPGYWARHGGQFRWVGGTWVPSDLQEIDYLDQAPPATLDLGPAGQAPSVDHFWVPGCWLWNGPGYAWRPGYWSVGHHNWVWVPHRFIWTPRGYLFCDGYWDHRLVDRGMLFAPYCFHQPVYLQPGFRFTPHWTIGCRQLQAHLWISPRLRHYCFGNFYSINHLHSGLYPWHSFHMNPAIAFGARTAVGYDPLFAHTSRIYATRGVNLAHELSQHHTVLSQHAELRPARTQREQQHRLPETRVTNLSTGKGAIDFWNNSQTLGGSLNDVARRDTSPWTGVSNQPQQPRVSAKPPTTRDLSAVRRQVESGKALGLQPLVAEIQRFPNPSTRTWERRSTSATNRSAGAGPVPEVGRPRRLWPPSSIQSGSVSNRQNLPSARRFGLEPLPGNLAPSEGISRSGSFRIPESSGLEGRTFQNRGSSRLSPPDRQRGMSNFERALPGFNSARMAPNLSPSGPSKSLPSGIGGQAGGSTGGVSRGADTGGSRMRGNR